MEAYTDFAQVYDTFMDETPYDEWADFLEEIINNTMELYNDAKRINDKYVHREKISEEENIVLKRRLL